MTRVEIEIDYNTIIMDKVSTLMSGFDLGIERLLVPPIVITYTTKTNVDKKYKEKIEKTLLEGYKDKLVIYGFKWKIVK